MIYRKKDGSLIRTYMTIVPYKERNEIKYYVAIGKDISKDKQFVEETTKFLLTDPITGLSSLTFFKRQLEDALKELNSNSDKPLGILVIIDPANFSLINNVYGFERGNAVLKMIGERIKKLPLF